jgi:outer membrane immunogenic protein
MRRHMKLIVAAVAMLGIGASGVASGADLAVKAPRAVVPLYNWTGCYIGGNVGGGWSKMDTTQVQIDTAPPTATQANFGSEKDSGFLGGGQVGCDFQTTNLVFGIEGQFDFGNINGTHSIPALPGFTESNNLKELYLITGRMGYLWTPQLLGYVKVGAAFQTNKNSIFLPSGALSDSAKFTDPGITAGIGFEYMFMPNWSVFAEANYVWTEDDSAAHDYKSSAGVPIEVINDRQRIISAMVGVNYKFHWDGPVVAKY